MVLFAFIRTTATQVRWSKRCHMRHSRAHSTSSTRYQQRSGTLKPAIWSKKLCYSHAIPVLFPWCYSHDAIPMMLFPWCYSHDAIPMMLFPCYSSHDAIPMMLFTWCYSHDAIPMMLFPWCYSHAIPMMLFPCYSHAIPMLFLCYSHAIPMLFPCYSYAIPMLFLCYSYAIPMLFLYYSYAIPSTSETANSQLWSISFHIWISWLDNSLDKFQYMELWNIKLDISAVLQNPSRPPPASIAASKIRPMTQLVLHETWQLAETADLMHSLKNKNKERKRKETKGTWLDLEKALAQTRGPLVGILLGWDWIHSPKASRSLNLLQLIHSNVFIYKQLPIIANSSQKSAWSKDITKAPLSKWWQVTVSTKGTISRCSKGQGTRKVAIKPGAIVDHPQHFIGLFPPPFSEGFLLICSSPWIPSGIRSI